MNTKTIVKKKLFLLSAFIFITTGCLSQVILAQESRPCENDNLNGIKTNHAT